MAASGDQRSLLLPQNTGGALILLEAASCVGGGTDSRQLSNSSFMTLLLRRCFYAYSFLFIALRSLQGGSTDAAAFMRSHLLHFNICLLQR